LCVWEVASTRTRVLEIRRTHQGLNNLHPYANN
jgi:hypothetical protein